MRLRIARHTTNLQAITNFYVNVLGLKVIGKFEDHNGYNGVFIGLPNTGWHLEFTTSAHAPQHQPDEDDLLVFYQETAEECEVMKQNFKDHNIVPVVAKNPYWNENGTTYPDPDGYNVVIAIAGHY